MTRTWYAISKCFFSGCLFYYKEIRQKSFHHRRLHYSSAWPLPARAHSENSAGNLDQDPDLVFMYILCSTLSCYISLYLTRPKNLVGLLIFFVYLWFVHNPGREDNKQFKKFQVFIPPVWQIHGLWQLERGCSEKFPRKQILGKRQHCVSGIPTTIELARILLFWNLNFCLEI